MIAKNDVKFTILTQSFNEVFLNKKLMLLLRGLTLTEDSGLNHELSSLEKISLNREAKAKIFIARTGSQIIGWAILSREYSRFPFPNGTNFFKPEYGSLFELFVSPQYRRQGVGTALFKEARKNAGPYQIGVCPWDKKSQLFFKKLNKYKTFSL